MFEAKLAIVGATYRRFCKLLRQKRGNVAVIFAFMMPLLVAGVGFGVETTYWFYKRLALQEAADAAAHAGAIERRTGASDAVVISVATKAATDNGFIPALGSITVNPQDVNAGGRVTVGLRFVTKRFILAVFDRSPVVIATTASATYNNAGSACILALDPTASKAANFSGTSNLTLNGCSVMANSRASDALNVQGSAQLNTTCAIAVGGVSATTGLTMTECTSPMINNPPVADPYRNLPAPTPTGACKASPNNANSITPGRYCSGMTFRGNTTLAPGIYYVEGDISLNANADISGSGVMFYITNGGSVTINGSARINVSAATTGTYKGMLFYGDRNSTGSGSRFNGTADSVMTGAIYFPNQDVQYNGNFSGANGCTQVVGRTVEWTGNTSVGIDCDAYGLTPIPVTSAVRLTA